MLIRDVRMEDFGNYSCSASNMLGKARAYITVQGEPMIENASYRQADSHITMHVKSANFQTVL